MALSNAEWKVMNALWRRHPARVREVIEELGDDADWAYTTVKTMLMRLVEKDFVRVRRDGNTGLFEPLLSRGQARTEAVRGLLERAFDGVAGDLVHHLVEDEALSESDRAELRAILEDGAEDPARKRRS